MSESSEQRPQWLWETPQSLGEMPKSTKGLIVYSSSHPEDPDVRILAARNEADKERLDDAVCSAMRLRLKLPVPREGPYPMMYLMADDRYNGFDSSDPPDEARQKEMAEGYKSCFLYVAFASGSGLDGFHVHKSKEREILRWVNRIVDVCVVLGRPAFKPCYF